HQIAAPSTWRERHWRSGHDRVDRGGLQRGHRRAGTVRRRHPDDAAHGRAGVSRDARFEIRGLHMYAAAFEYFRAQSIKEAQQLLQQHPGAKVLAGGHSLIPLLKMRLTSPSALVDIGRIPELKGIAAKDG